MGNILAKYDLMRYLKKQRSSRPNDGFVFVISIMHKIQFAKNPSGTSGYGNFYISECSIWSRVLSDDDVAELYNDGDGRAIY